MNAKRWSSPTLLTLLPPADLDRMIMGVDHDGRGGGISWMAQVGEQLAGEVGQLACEAVACVAAGSVMVGDGVGRTAAGSGVEMGHDKKINGR
ncbi:hypothetical protein ACLOJK_015287 [Asimina triloba]